MIKRTDRFHLSRLATAAVIGGLITAAGWWTWNRVEGYHCGLLAQKNIEQEATRIEGLVGQLFRADPNQIPAIIKELDANQNVASTFLSPLVSSNPTTLDEKRSQLHAWLVMFRAIRRLKNLWWKNFSATRSSMSLNLKRNGGPSRI